MSKVVSYDGKKKNKEIGRWIQDEDRMPYLSEFNTRTQILRTPVDTLSTWAFNSIQ